MMTDYFRQTIPLPKYIEKKKHHLHFHYSSTAEGEHTQYYYVCCKCFVDFRFRWTYKGIKPWEDKINQCPHKNHPHKKGAVRYLCIYRDENIQNIGIVLADNILEALKKSLNLFNIKEDITIDNPIEKAIQQFQTGKGRKIDVINILTVMEWKQYREIQLNKEIKELEQHIKILEKILLENKIALP